MTHSDGNVAGWEFPRTVLSSTSTETSQAASPGKASMVAQPAASEAPRRPVLPAPLGSTTATCPATASSAPAGDASQGAAASQYPTMGSPPGAAAASRDASQSEKVTAEGLLRKLQLLTASEKKECAEESRGALVKLWREKAKPEKKGKAFRGIIDPQCMTGIPELLQARCGEKKVYHLYVNVIMMDRVVTCRSCVFLSVNLT